MDVDYVDSPKESANPPIRGQAVTDTISRRHRDRRREPHAGREHARWVEMAADMFRVRQSTLVALAIRSGEELKI